MSKVEHNAVPLATHPLPVSKEGANKGERHRDQEPEGQEGQQGGEGDGRTGPFVPQHQVHDEEQSKHNTETKASE